MAVYGAKNGNSKLTADQVLAIRRIHAEGGRSYTDVAALFGITRMTAWQIVNRTRWAHLPPAETASSDSANTSSEQ